MAYSTNSSVPACGEAIAPRRVVTVTNGELFYAADYGDRVAGVSWESGAEGDVITVIGQGSGTMLDVVSSETVNAGDILCVGDSSGRVFAVPADYIDAPWGDTLYSVSIYMVGRAEADSVGGQVRATIAPGLITIPNPD